MVTRYWFALVVTASVALSVDPGVVRARASQEEAAPKAVASPEELVAEVPALDDLHDVVHPLWHDAYPAKNFQLVKELLPEADVLVANLDAAKLPGILRDKQAAWDEGKRHLKAALAALHAAAAANDEAAMLQETEAFHAAFEKLVRTIRPVVPALDEFHQQLYQLYHYDAPDYDLARIRAAASAMKERIAPLAASKLSPRLQDRQEKFDAAVVVLASAVDDLIRTAEQDSREAILSAVEKVHTAYLMTEGIFDAPK